MNDPERKDCHNYGPDEKSTAETQRNLLDAEGHEYPHSSAAPNTKRQKIKKYFQALFAEKPDRHIELLLTLAITFFACVQLFVSCSNNSSTSDQMDKMILITQRNERAATRFADSAKRIGNAADRFSTSAANINTAMGQAVAKLDSQAKASQKSAGAAESAADTAKTALEVSERAYLTTDVPVMSANGTDVSIPITNRGRIPSGTGVFIVHEATINTTVGPTTQKIMYAPAETHWKHYPSSNIAPSLQSPIMIPVLLTAVDITKFNTGFQQVILVGSIAYNDGFSDTPERYWKFCYISILMPNPPRPTWGSCDPVEYLGPMITNDGYPNN